MGRANGISRSGGEMTDNESEFKRIRDLPEHEQKPFLEFLHGQTRPLVEGIPDDEQDFYYECDYLNWKQPPRKRFWD